MTLKEDLQQQLARFMKSAPPEVATTIQAHVDQLNSSGIVERAVGEGETAPDFCLPNARGKLVSLSVLLANGPVVLTFYRGGWCPYCNLQLRAYQRIVPELQGYGAQLVAVSPVPPDASLSTQEKNALTFEVLSDVKMEATRAYRLLFDLPEELRAVYHKLGRDLSQLNADHQWHLPAPATYVIAPNRNIVLAYVDPEYRNRLEPTAIIESLQTLKQYNHA